MATQISAAPATSSELTEMLSSLPECMGADVEPLACTPPRNETVSCADVVDVAEQLLVDFTRAPFTPQQLHLGMSIEAEQRNLESDLLDEDLMDLGRIAVINLQRRPDYYKDLTSAHAPGDPVSVPYHLLDVGTD